MSFRFLILLPVALLFVSCSSTEKASAPKLGSPAYSFNAANESLKRGDYVSAYESLGKVVSNQSEFTAQARVLHVVLGAGLARGYMELADMYENGAKFHRTNPQDYRSRIPAIRRRAAQMAFQFAENLRTVREDQTAKLDFTTMTPDAAEPAALAKVKQGLVLMPSDHEALIEGMAKHSVSEIAKEIGGNPTREVFLTAMARALTAQADLFSQRKLDEPKKAHALLSEALTVVKGLPETKETKELGTKISDQLKKVKIAS
jgi:hypothetical protein